MPIDFISIIAIVWWIAIYPITIIIIIISICYLFQHHAERISLLCHVVYEHVNLIKICITTYGINYRFVSRIIDTNSTLEMTNESGAEITFRNYLKSSPAEGASRITNCNKGAYLHNRFCCTIWTFVFGFLNAWNCKRK